MFKDDVCSILLLAKIWGKKHVNWYVSGYVNFSTSIKWNAVQQFKKKSGRSIYSDMERYERSRLGEKSVLQNSAYGPI